MTEIAADYRSYRAADKSQNEALPILFAFPKNTRLPKDLAVENKVAGSDYRPERSVAPDYDLLRHWLQFDASKIIAGVPEAVLSKLNEYHFGKNTLSTTEFQGTEAILSTLEQDGFTLANLSVLRNVLIKYSFLLPILKEAKGVLETLYPTAVFRLQPMWLSDDTGGVEFLIELSGDDDIDAAYTSLETFDNTWWLANLRRAEARISILLDFV